MKIIKLYLFIIMLSVINNCGTQKVINGEDTAPVNILVNNAKLYENQMYFNSSKEPLSIILQTVVIDTKTVGGDNPFEKKIIYGYREGYCKEGKQEGKWIATRFYDYDSLGYSKTKKHLIREEYFKNGLRDSIYKIYNKEGKIIFSTYFKNGTGLEKDFHENGKLYYEIATKDGYFTDTLKLYNVKGELAEKRLYKKDSLIFKENMIIDDFPTDNK
ncbi:MAG: hypothetical protein ABI576_06010 [Flavobacterium sp.]